MKKLLIYDLDGTLVDTGEDICRSANAMRASYGLPPLEREKVDRFVGRGVHHLIGNCLETQDEKRIEKGIKIYRAYYGEHMMDHSRLYPDALKMLEHFRDRIQTVLTNKPNPHSREMLDNLGVGRFFSEIIAGNSGFAKKPAPDPVHHWKVLWGLKESDIVMVGDSLIDIETCRNAGIECAVLSHGFGTADELKSASPNYYADSFQELLAIAIKEGW